MADTALPTLSIEKGTCYLLFVYDVAQALVASMAGNGCASCCTRWGFACAGWATAT
jgi:hypothetical protein